MAHNPKVAGSNPHHDQRFLFEAFTHDKWVVALGIPAPQLGRDPCKPKYSSVVAVRTRHDAAAMHKARTRPVDAQNVRRRFRRYTKTLLEIAQLRGEIQLPEGVAVRSVFVDGGFESGSGHIWFGP